MAIIKKPNLPDKKVIDVIVSSDAIDTIKTLKTLGINSVLMPKNPLFDTPVQSHADMSFLHVSDNVCFIQEENNSIVKKITNLGFSVKRTKNTYNKKYPSDVGLNCVIIGEYLIGREASIDKAVLEYCEENNIKIINVNQGYCKCSICLIDQNSIITEDQSICNALKSKFDVLKINSGYVQLKGYNYGFFGGCTGLVDKKTLAINGEIKYHKDKDEIISFLKERNVQLVELKSGYLEDIGSIIPLREE